MENSDDQLEGSVAHQGGGAIALMAAAAIALAACSGGGGLNEDEAAGILQELKEAKAQAATDVAARVAAETQAAAALAAQQTAEAGKLKAEAEKTAAETAKAAADTAREAAVTNAEAAQKAAEDAAASAREAAAALVVAQAAEQKAKADQKEAEDDRDAAETALATARQQLQTARAATTAEEQRRQQAEAEQDRLAQVAEDAQQQVDQASARTVLVGLGGLDEEMASIISAPDLAVTPSYRAAAGVRGTPNVTFDKSRATTGSQGRWLRTSYSNRGASSVDRMDVYSDVDASTSVPFKDSDYNDGSSDNSVVGKFDAALVGTTVVNAEGDVVNWLGVMDTQDDTASSAFPRTSATGVKSFSLIDRGRLTQMGYDDLTPEEKVEYRQESHGGRIRNPDVDPQRYEYETSGTLGGASGTYRCASDSLVPCTVRNGGSHFVFAGPWTFRPSSGTSRVRVEDTVYMHFGWWSRQAISDGSWSFRTFHGDGDDSGSRVALDEITGNDNDVSGTATYQGPAVGYYAIYQPLGGGVGLVWQT